MKFKLIQRGKESRDCTAPYNVELLEEMTLEQFIQEVLKRKEWGYIGIKSDTNRWFGDPKIEYKNDKTLQDVQVFGEMLTMKLIKVTASGGWSRMDYICEVDNVL